MEQQRRRGRPPTFLREDREYLAGLIRMNGITGARREASFPVCHRTLINIAREFGIVLTKGRRPKRAYAVRRMSRACQLFVAASSIGAKVGAYRCKTALDPPTDGHNNT